MHITRNVQFYENTPYFSSSECFLQGERVSSILEYSTLSLLPIPSLLSPSTPSLSISPRQITEDNPRILPTSSPSSPNTSILSISPGQITEDSLRILLRPENNQDSTSSQSTPEAEESRDVHNEVNSSLLATPNIEPRYAFRINRRIPKR